MKIYTVVWSDRGPKQLDSYHTKFYTAPAPAKAQITRRFTRCWKPDETVSAFILESEINWTPWEGK